MAKLNFQQALLQSYCDPSEIILIYCFGAQFFLLLLMLKTVVLLKTVIILSGVFDKDNFKGPAFIWKQKSFVTL